MRRVSWRTPAFVGLLGFASLVAPAAEPHALSAARTAPSEPPYGIEDHRVPWTTSHVVGSPNPPPYRFRRAFPNRRRGEPMLELPVQGDAVQLDVGRNDLIQMRVDF